MLFAKLALKRTPISVGKMPFCPNPHCDHRKRLGEPAEFESGVTTCSDCGSTLSESAPHFEVEAEQEPQNVPGWTCPQCGSINREDISICVCGYDFNRPYINSQSARAAGAGETFSDQNIASEQRVMAVEFNGQSHEYFRIWIVNLCLTLLTFGIFSAWAKVRKKRYFYSHTRLDGTPFQYLGQPIPILKGRVIAAIAFITYYTASHFLTALLPYVFTAGAILTPWVIARSAAFNARYSAFRNMTFHFDGGYLDALKAIYALGIVPFIVLGTMFDWWGKNVILAGIIVALGLSLPWWIKRLKNFLISHSSYGGRKGVFSATGGQFFSVYFKSGLILVAVAIITGIFTAVTAASMAKKSQLVILLALVPMYAGYVMAYAYVQAHSSNLVWNNTRLGPLRFHSTLSGGGMAKLYVTNALAIIASLGLMIPWAVMRTLKYRADNMRVLQDGEITEFQGSDLSAVEAIGAETVEFFDMDISL